MGKGGGDGGEGNGEDYGNAHSGGSNGRTVNLGRHYVFREVNIMLVVDLMAGDVGIEEAGAEM